MTISDLLVKLGLDTNKAQQSFNNFQNYIKNNIIKVNVDANTKPAEESIKNIKNVAEKTKISLNDYISNFRNVFNSSGNLANNLTSNIGTIYDSAGSLTSAMTSVARKIGLVGAAIGAVGGAMYSLGKQSLSLVQDLKYVDNLANRLSVDSQKLQAFREIAINTGVNWQNAVQNLKLPDLRNNRIKETLAEIGLTEENISKDAVDFIGQITGKWEHLSQVQRQNLKKDLKLNEDMLSMIELGPDLYNSMYQEQLKMTFGTQKWAALSDKFMVGLARLKSSLKWVWNNFLLKIASALHPVVDIFNDIATETKDWANAFAGIGRIISFVMSLIANGFRILVKLGAPIFKILLKPFEYLELWMDDFEVWMAGGESLIGKYLGDFKNFAQTIKNIFTFEGLRATIANIFNWILEKIQQIITYISDTCNNIYNYLQSTIANMSELWNSFKEFMANILQNILNSWENYWNSALDSVTNIFTSIYNYIADTMNNIKNYISDIINWITSKFSWIFDTANKIKSSLSFDFSLSGLKEKLGFSSSAGDGKNTTPIATTNSYANYNTANNSNREMKQINNINISGNVNNPGETSKAISNEMNHIMDSYISNDSFE